MLNGMTFPLFWVAGVAFANDASPEGMKATGQGILAGVSSGIGAATGGMVCNLLLGSLGGQAMFWLVGVGVLVGVVVVAGLQRSRQSRLAKVKTPGL